MDHNNFSFRRWFVTVFLILLAIAAYVVGYRVTEINPVKLFTSLPKSQKILSDLIHPELFTHKTQETTFDVVFPVPCGSAQSTQLPDTGPRIVPTVSCANPGDIITLQGVGMLPNQEIKIEWLLPSGRSLFSKLAKADASGNFTTQVEVRPINATIDGTPSHLQVETSVPVGGWIPSSTLTDVLDNIIVTVFMALLATTAGTIVAAPISFLAARNIMGRNWLGTSIYTLVRAILNVIRSYKSLVLATVFALWVGFGAFAGVLALTVVTIASLGKLFSEAVESIDAGPIEAVSATGANPVEVVRLCGRSADYPGFHLLHHLPLGYQCPHQHHPGFRRWRRHRLLPQPTHQCFGIPKSRYSHLGDCDRRLGHGLSQCGSAQEVHVIG